MNNFGTEEPRLVNPDRTGLNAFFKKVYGYMFLALLVTAATSYVGVTVFAVQIATMLSNPIAILILAGIMMAVASFASGQSMSNPGRSFGLMMGYSVLMGVFFTAIALTVNLGMIFSAFVTTAAVFGGMALYGLNTKRDMSSMSALLFGAVIALIIGGIINLFFFNSVVYLLISVIGVVVFSLMTAYDMNKLKQLYFSVQGNTQGEQGVAVFGALSLYLDFVNLFIYILRLFQIFGNNND